MRLAKEFGDLKENPIENVSISHKTKDLTCWNICITAEKGSPYQGGKFNIEADFTDNYPFKAPKCKFTTKIYHPNV